MASKNRNLAKVASTSTGHMQGDSATFTDTVTASSFIGSGSSLTGIDTTVSESDVTAHQAALSITESQISDLGSYITDYTVTQGDVTAHQAALSVTESQISDLGSYLTSGTDQRADIFQIGVNTNHYILVGTTEIDFRLDGNLDMRLENDGDLHVDGDVIAYSTTTSDSRLKDNVTTIENGLDKVCAMRGVEFDWNSTSRKGQHDIGVIAQEVEAVIPEVVREKTLVTGEHEGAETTVKTVDYEKLVGVLIEAVKELKAEIDELKGTRS